MVKCPRDANHLGGGVGKFKANGHQLSGRGGVVVIVIMFHGDKLFNGSTFMGNIPFIRQRHKTANDRQWGVLANPAAQ